MELVNLYRALLSFVLVSVFFTFLLGRDYRDAPALIPATLMVVSFVLLVAFSLAIVLIYLWAL